MDWGLWVISGISGLAGSAVTLVVDVLREKHSLKLRTNWELKQKTFLEVLAISKRLDEIALELQASSEAGRSLNRNEVNRLAKSVNEADRVGIFNALQLSNAEVVLSKFQSHGDDFDLVLANFIQYEKALNSKDSQLVKRLRTEIVLGVRQLKKASAQLLEQMKSEIS